MTFRTDLAALRSRIRPPFWGTWWFRLLGLAAAAGALLAVHRSRLEASRRAQRQAGERALAAEREGLIAELEAKNQELESFTYTVSHDLKSPLFTIKGFLGLARKDAAAGNQERLLQDIERSEAAAEKMQQLLEGLLELSRIGRVVYPPEKVALTELVREAAGIVGELQEGGGIEVEIAADLPVVLVDRVRILEVFQNLLENAAKYMGDQAAPRIEVAARRDGTEEVVCVRDNGPGVEPRYHEEIFKLFQRLDTGQEGTGIGLALAQRIVEVHGGRLWVESEGGGRGSTFCLTLPRGSGDAAADSD